MQGDQRRVHGGFQTISYFIRWLTKVIVHRLLLHPWGNNLWDDAWRHKNRLREGIFGQCQFLKYPQDRATGSNISFQFQVNMRNSPLSRTPPTNLPSIPGVTSDLGKKEQKLENHI